LLATWRAASGPYSLPTWSSLRWWVLVFRPAPLLAAALLAMALAAQVAAGEGGVYAVEFHVASGVALVELNVSTSRYVAASSVVELELTAKLAYTTLNDSLVLVVDAELGNVTLGSAILSPLAAGHAASGRIVAPVPPQALRGVSTGPAFLRLRLTLYSGSESDTRELLIPVVVVEEEPGLQVIASYRNGGTVAVAVAGRDTAVTVFARIVNTGSAVAEAARATVELNGVRVFTRSLGDIAPGGQAELAATVPVPQEPGNYRVNVTASAVCGATPCGGHALLRLLVFPDVQVSAVLLNTSVLVEGERVCLKPILYPAGVELPGRVVLLLEERPAGAPTWTPVAEAPLGADALCTVVQGVPPGRETLLELRVRLVAAVDGVAYSAASSPVTVRVVPASEVLRHASLALTVEPTKAYIMESMLVSVSMSPSVAACLPLRVEAFRGEAWTPVASGRLCNGHAAIEVDASRLGTGRHLVRVVVEAGGRRLASEPLRVEVYPLPRLVARLEPQPAAPGQRVLLRLALEPALHPLRASILLGWSGVALNASSPTGSLEVPIDAPREPGSYMLRVTLVSGGYRASRNLTLTVERPRLLLAVSPAKAEPGEEIVVNVSLRPPAPAKIVLRLLRDGRAVLNETLYAPDGAATVRVRAPQEPGEYLVEATAPALNASATARLVVEAPRHRLRLALNATSAAPGAPLAATVELTPPPSSPTIVAIVARPAGNESTEITLGSVTVGPSGRAATTVRAPSRPGRYLVRALASQLGAESPPVELTVTAAAETSRQQPPLIEAGMAGAAVAAIAWSFRSLRRSR